jgi:hypothetical protein
MTALFFLASRTSADRNLSSKSEGARPRGGGGIAAFRSGGGGGGLTAGDKRSGVADARWRTRFPSDGDGSSRSADWDDSRAGEGRVGDDLGTLPSRLPFEANPNA